MLTALNLVGYTQNNPAEVLTVDTINISGKVINENGEVVAGATILSTSLDSNLNYIHTKTDKKGKFMLKGIRLIELLTVFEKDRYTEVRNHGSRFVLITLVPLVKKNLNDLNSRYKDFVIGAKRLKPKEKFTFKAKSRVFSSMKPTIIIQPVILED